MCLLKKEILEKKKKGINMQENYRRIENFCPKGP